MIIGLTNKQRRFLLYIQEHHFSLGYTTLVGNILHKGTYDDTELLKLKYIRGHHKKLLIELNGGEKHEWFNIGRYGTPTKFLGE
jgi:hypothetical protein